ncbi:hypothetical protein ATJ88_0328 [Isoptericola jiangsuensis]|uniref:PGAP1-like protein n=1 Tax=Isoptericola jiangsuensis TaxID=548579 RepID=A0A2A9ESY9_9MICO|nr:hypothetical protein [Isoptericola jiangsuensis]PFG41686.1 hypothetical protein ATJ88_0328 [Isoptericola jiangsuensis]
MTQDPRGTLVVTGGRPVDRVDAAAVRTAALRASDAAAVLRAATGDCLSARTALDRLRRTTPLGPPDPALPGRVAWALTLAGDALDALAGRADRCASLADRLLVAAGLYEDAESTVEQLVGAIVAGTTGVLGFGVTTFALHPAGGLPSLVVLWGGVRLLDALAGDDPAHADPSIAPGPAAPPGPQDPQDPQDPGDDGGLLGDLLRTLSPYTDEAVTGAGQGVALAAPFLALGDVSVTGGARVLSTLVDAFVGRRDVEVREVTSVRRDDRATRPPGTVDELAARTGDLYPAGSGVAGRDVPGVPPGTIAVQRVEHADGPATWVVTVPGTQALVSRDHAFDGVTDLDLMAGEAAEVARGVMAALDDAGAAPDEPVVLAGHSLGGIAVTSLAAMPAFRARHPVAGVVTLGAPTGTFTTPRGVPVLHVENTEELVSPLDGRSGAANPATPDRVTLARTLADSADPADRAASGSVPRAHQVGTHVRTIGLARDAGNVQVADVAARIEEHLDGESATTRYYQVGRSRPQDD